MAVKVYTFHIEYKDIPDKMWRDIQVSGNKTLADLGYVILAAFDTMAYHLFNIKVNGETYETDIEMYHDCKLMRDYKLSQLDITIDDVLEMVYDYGCNQEFTIKLINIEDMKRGKGNSYPKIIDGAGRSIIDDMPSFELQKIIDETDKNGKSSYKMRTDFGSDFIYDYRNFDLRVANALLKGDTMAIKYGYENPNG